MIFLNLKIVQMKNAVTEIIKTRKTRMRLVRTKMIKSTSQRRTDSRPDDRQPPEAPAADQVRHIVINLMYGQHQYGIMVWY